MQIPQADWLRTIDVSQFNNGGQPIDWLSVVPHLPPLRIGRVIVRSSYGSGYIDPQFAANWQALKSLKVPVGVYHAAMPGASPNLYAHAQAQAAFFLEAVGKVGGIQGTDWPILDLENTGGLTPDQLALWAQHWIGCVNAAVKNPKNPVLFYSYSAFIAQHLGLYATVAHTPLWLAAYPAGASLPTTAPANVGGWTQYFGWQYTDAAQIPGITGAVDESVFAISIVDSSPVIPDPEPDPVIHTLQSEVKTLETKIAAAQKALQ